MDKYQQIAYEWEKRSLKYGTKIEGVLPKSFPTIVNNYLHQWMLRIISKVIVSVDQKEIKILDLGCGYGRLSKELLNKFSNIKIFGVDISQYYINLYNDSLKPRGVAVKADLRNLPFENNQFDVVFIVTTLMYLITEKDQMKAMKEIFRVTKPGGKIVLIERNKPVHNIFMLWGLISLIRGKKNKEINSVSFEKDYMIELISKQEGNVIKMEGVPFWTVLLPILIVLSKTSKNLGRVFLNPVRLLDGLFNWLLTPSLYISYIVQKK